MQSEPHPSEDDSLDLNSVDREVRINELKRQLTEIAGGDVSFGSADGCNPHLEEAFLQHVLAFESERGIRPIELLTRDGFKFESPQELTDAALPAKLLELIRALAGYRLYLEHTDHLSDRELYSWLRDEVLRHEYQGLGVLDGNWHVDVLGGCSEEDLILSMRYYATAEERAEWAGQFADFPMPPQEKPPYDRDRYLPQPDYP